MALAKPLQKWSSLASFVTSKERTLLPPPLPKRMWRGHHCFRGRIGFLGEFGAQIASVPVERAQNSLLTPVTQRQLLHINLTTLLGSLALCSFTGEDSDAQPSAGPNPWRLEITVTNTKWKECCFPEHSRSFTMYWGACFSSPLSYEQ